MPTTFIYLSCLLIIIIIWFFLLKRPIYEAIFIGFLVLLTVTNRWSNIGLYLNKALSTSILYSMTAFVAMSVILTKTKIIDSCIAVILSLLGRFTGGAGYVSVIASAFMGSLSGSGPGNVMATGSISIPAMKKSGFPAELAANIESNASYLGNMIPPSSNILAAFGAFTALYPETSLSQGHFWIVLWSISFWFIAQRLLMVYVFCKYYKIQPLSKEDLPNLKDTLRKGWQGLFLPVIILLPFVLDYLYKDSFFTERLGATGAKFFSNSLLFFIAGVSAFYACLIAKEKPTPHKIAIWFADNIKTIVPAIGVCLFGYMIGSLFSDLNTASDIEAFIIGMNLNKLGLILFICVITCLLGMVIPGSSLVVILGPVFISALVSAGVNGILAAAMLPCICGVMCGITPPLGLGMYAGMSLAGSDFNKTFKNNLWWVAAQFIMEVIILMEWLPIFGL